MTRVFTSADQTELQPFRNVLDAEGIASEILWDAVGLGPCANTYRHPVDEGVP